MYAITRTTNAPRTHHKIKDDLQTQCTLFTSYTEKKTKQKWKKKKKCNSNIKKPDLTADEHVG